MYNYKFPCDYGKIFYFQRHMRICRRVFRDRHNPLEFMDDVDLLHNYRLDRQTIFYLCTELQNGLSKPSYRNHALPVPFIVTIALRYCATRSFQSNVAYSHGVRAMSVSRSVHSVSSELCGLYDNHIHFPTS